MKHIAATKLWVMFMYKKNKLHAGRKDMLIFRAGQVSMHSGLGGG